MLEIKVTRWHGLSLTVLGFFLKAFHFQPSLDRESRAEEPQDTEIQLKQSVEPSLAPKLRSAMVRTDQPSMFRTCSSPEDWVSWFCTDYLNGTQLRSSITWSLYQLWNTHFTSPTVLNKRSSAPVKTPEQMTAPSLPVHFPAARNSNPCPSWMHALIVKPTWQLQQE